jgi:Icc-related predicted phosphoesterase
MFVRIVSDLHLEFAKSNMSRLLLAKPTDYLVIAGDMCTTKTIKQGTEFLETLDLSDSTGYKAVLFVLGNHEYYHGLHPAGTVKMYKDAFKHLEKVHVLENEVWTDGRVSFFGTTLWSDITDGAFVQMADSLYMSKDFYLKKHQEARAALESLPPVDVVITHHLPSHSLTAEKYKGSTANSAFAATCDHVLDRAKKLWVYGHSHHRDRRVLENGTVLVTNAVGYPGELDKWVDVVEQL